MQTHTITLKARVFSDEENDTIIIALKHFVDSSDSSDSSDPNDINARNVARTLIAELGATT